MKRIGQEKWVIMLLLAVAVCSAIYAYFFQQVSSDNIILFLGSRFFQAEWLKQGVFPLYNPNVYAGFPFAGDLGLTNFHPFSLLFLLPFPFSVSLWTFCTSFLFLVGFYLFFRQFTQTQWYSFILTIALFLSGSGIIRIINPSVYSVVAHVGMFLYSLSFLKRKKILFPLCVGILMTVSGHIQIVWYGYLLGIFILFYYYRCSVKQGAGYFLLLFISTSWFYFLSLPIVLTSTRMTESIDYKVIGNTYPFHFITWLLPYLFGEVHNGSKWNVGIPYQISMSLFAVFFPIYLIFKKKIPTVFYVFFAIILLGSLGVINFPFFRGAVQIFIMFHILLFTLLSQKEREAMDFMRSDVCKKISIFIFIFCGTGFFLTSTDIASNLFDQVYLFVKHGQRSLFYDSQTIRAILSLLQHSLVPGLLFSLLFFSYRKTRFFVFLIFIFVVVEGSFYFYLQTYAVPTKVIKTQVTLPKSLDLKNYRVQTTADTIPYFGYFVYHENISFRPPFGKEKTLFTEEEEKTFNYYLKLQDYLPLGFPFDRRVKTLQTFSTFTPKKICKYFNEPSRDWRTEYKYITDKNPLFGIKVYDVCTNSIETSRVTMYDKRWENLAVRYFISDRPLRGYRLIYKDHRFFYENINAPPIYGIVNKDRVLVKTPYYEDPNIIKFNIEKQDVGKTLQIIINPDGFAVSYNGKAIEPGTESFKLLVPLTQPGEILVYYSPIKHLIDALSKKI